MQLKYGTYAFPSNGVIISTDAQLMENDAGEPYSMMLTYDSEGWLEGTTQATLTAAQLEFEAAMRRQYQDLIFYADDGSKSSIVMDNRSSISGVRIQGWTFANTKGPEFATGRYFKFKASAEYPLTTNQLFLLSFTETVSYSGGGPVYGHLESVNGLAQKQLLQQQESYKVTQKGEAVGYLAYPRVPAPLFPGAQKRQVEVVRTSPRRRRQGRERWPISYTYEFEANYPLVALPTLWFNV